MSHAPCSKCGGTDLAVQYIACRQLINHSGRQKVETEFVTSDEYDFYWKHTAAKEHLVKQCRVCGFAWRENVLQEQTP